MKLLPRNVLVIKTKKNNKKTSNLTGRSYKICSQNEKKRKDLLPKEAITSADKSAAPKIEDSAPLSNIAAPTKKILLF